MECQLFVLVILIECVILVISLQLTESIDYFHIPGDHSAIFEQFCFLHLTGADRSRLAECLAFETLTQCALIQEKEIIDIPFIHEHWPQRIKMISEKLEKNGNDVPAFLRDANKSYCQVTRGEFRDKGLIAVNNKHPKTNLGMLQCGNTDIYIKPECVCSFYNVFNASLYHEHSSCPEGTDSDVVIQLKCPDCKKYSLNNNGPCVNGGELICKGQEVAPETTCQCPPNYEGSFCEKKVETMTRICNRISKKSSFEMENCNSTWRDCVIHSRNQKYAYRCQGVNISQDIQGLPLCLDTENTTEEDISLNPIQSQPEHMHIHWAGAFYFSMFVVFAFVAFILFVIITFWMKCRKQMHIKKILFK